jgi:hypothetical protein
MGEKAMKKGDTVLKDSVTFFGTCFRIYSIPCAKTLMRLISLISCERTGLPEGNHEDQAGFLGGGR